MARKKKKDKAKKEASRKKAAKKKKTVKKKAASKVRSKSVTVPFTAEEHRRLVKAAKYAGLSVADLIASEWRVGK